MKLPGNRSMPGRKPSPPVSPIANTAALEPDAYLAPVHRAGFFLLTIFIFAVFSRVLDVTIPILRLPFVLSMAAFLCLIFSGGLQRAFAHLETKMMLGFTAWWILIIPLASWRGGAFEAFKEYWFKSVLCFFMIVGLTVTLKQVKRLMITVALATLVLTVMALVKQHRVMDRLSFPVGLFSNPNDLAQALLIGVPLLFTLLLDKGHWFYKVLIAGALAPMMLAIAQTGSRTALVGLAIMLFLVFLRVRYMTKVSMLIALTAGAAVMITTLPETVRYRYLTMFQNTDEAMESTDEEVKVAVASAESREYLFWQSVSFTLRNPVFGVGPACFQHASVQESQAAGQRGMWRETHNMYTQVSAECGIPGFLMYFGTVFVLFRKFRALRKEAEADPRLAEVRKILLIYSSSFVGVLVTGAFSSVAYQMVVPSMIGLAVAVTSVARNEVNRIRATEPAPAPAPVPVGMSRPAPPRAVRPLAVHPQPARVQPSFAPRPRLR